MKRKMKVFVLSLFAVSITISLFLGCDDGMQMMQPIVKDPVVLEEPTDTSEIEMEMSKETETEIVTEETETPDETTPGEDQVAMLEPPVVEEPAVDYYAIVDAGMERVNTKLTAAVEETLANFILIYEFISEEDLTYYSLQILVLK